MDNVLTVQITIVQIVQQFKKAAGGEYVGFDIAT